MARTSSIHVYDHFDLYLTPVTLTFNLPEKMFQMALPPSQGQQLCQTVLKSMHYCTSYGPDKFGRTHRHTHIHQTKIVTTMSRLPASWLDKNHPVLLDTGCRQATFRHAKTLCNLENRGKVT